MKNGHDGAINAVMSENTELNEEEKYALLTSIDNVKYPNLYSDVYNYLLKHYPYKQKEYISMLEKGV